MSFLSKTIKPAVPDSSLQDVELPEGPSDSISGLCFSPVADFLAVSSWDGDVRLYQVAPNLSALRKYSHGAPVLDVCWSNDGKSVVSAGIDKAARLHDVESNAIRQVAAHDEAVRCVRYSDMHGGMLITGSWDKTIKYWDLRSEQPAATVQLEERCYAMDVCGQLMVAGLAERKIQIFNLQNMTTPFGPTIDSPLKFQTRSIACFPDQAGYAVGSIEGRVAIQYIDENRAKSDNFSFKCHRKGDSKAVSSLQSNDTQAQIFAVNAISFHPTYGTFSTAGSDGTISFWDKANKTRLKSLNLIESNGNVDQPLPVVCTAYNRINSSTIFAYAISYDWSHGYRGNAPNHVNKVKLHACKDDEMKPRPKV